MASVRLAEANKVFATKGRNIQPGQYFGFKPVTDIVSGHFPALFCPPCADPEWVSVRRSTTTVHRAGRNITMVLVQDPRAALMRFERSRIGPWEPSLQRYLLGNVVEVPGLHSGVTPSSLVIMIWRKR